MKGYPQRVTNWGAGLFVLCLVISSCAPSSGFVPPIDGTLLSLAAIDASNISTPEDTGTAADIIAAYYKDPVLSKNVVAFFTAMTKAEPITRAILDGAVLHDVPVSLAFALAYEESVFDPNAVGENPDSYDRGLFQLNSRSFPAPKGVDVFDPAWNSRTALGYFKDFLDISGNEVTALAMYNAGQTRVVRGSTPQRTLGYIARVLKYEENISKMFRVQVLARTPFLEKIRFGLSSKPKKQLTRPAG